MKRTSILLLPLMISGALTAGFHPARAGEVTQRFPANPGEKMRTEWRVQWAYERATEGRVEVPVITGAWFKRSPEDLGLQVISNLRVAEIETLYKDDWLLDTDQEYGGGLVKATKDDLGPACVVKGEVLDDHLLKEVHDDGVRYRPPGGKVRRGQKMVLWSTLKVANYCYIIEYGFRDDGSITCRLGATGYVSPIHLRGRHLHTAFWRVVMSLGNPAGLSVKEVRYRDGARFGFAR